MAEGLAVAGARVIISGTNAETVDATVAAMTAAGHRAMGAPFDVTSEADVVRIFGEFDAKGIAVDILVNNAGIQFRKPMVELQTADWQRVIDTNLTSAFVIGREAAKRMIPRGYGKIINIGSLTSELARATVAPYTVAKGGIKMLTRAMAAEWAEHGPAGERDRAGLHAHRYEPGAHRQRGLRCLGQGAHALEALGQARGIDRRGGVSRFAGFRTTSTARSSMSMEACWRFCKIYTVSSGSMLQSSRAGSIVFSISANMPSTKLIRASDASTARST